jgi:hypothetical protein
MSPTEPRTLRDRFAIWFTLERQWPIALGVSLLLGLWVGEVLEPFALGIPAYAFYFVFSGIAQQLGLIGIEGSRVIFWASAVLWLYLFCSVLFYIAIVLARELGEDA